MNTKISTSFGLALLVAIAAIATMFATGLFSAKPASAGHVVSSATHVIAMTPSSLSVNGASSWTITLGVSGAALTAGSGTIAITFPSGVVIPATIDKSRISAGGDTAGNGTYGLDPLTSDPTISGQTVTLTVPATNAAGGAVSDAIAAGDQVKVFFSQLAGLENPPGSGAAGSTAAGTAGKINTSADVENGNIPTALTFARTISLGGATSQTQGGAVTVTIGGFTAGLTVTLSGAVSGSAVVGDDKKAEIAGTMSGTAGTVTATDTAGLTAISGSIAVKPELTATATGKSGDSITLTGKNFTDASTIASIADILWGASAITAAQVSTDLPYSLTDKDLDGDDDDFSITIKVPSDAAAGVTQLKVTDANSVSSTANVTITGRTVTISPDTGPPGTIVTIVGSGFPESRSAAAGNTIAISPVWGSTTITNLFTDGSGNLPGSDQFTIPASATTAKAVTLTVTIVGADSVGATGSDSFTVTSRVLVVSPSSGPKGTTILVTGSKFTGSSTVTADTITVGGASTTHALANLTSAGDVPGVTLAVPSGASTGANTVSLADTASTPLSGSATFTVTVPTIALGVTEAYMGQSVPVTGAGWVPSSSVTLTLKNGSTTVATKVATADGSGDIADSMTVPSTVGVGPVTVTFTGADAATYGNTSLAKNLTIPKPSIALSVAEAEVGALVDVTATGFPPLSGLSILTIGGADVRVAGEVNISNAEGSLTTSFTVPGVTGSNIVSVKIGAEEVSTSISVVAATVAAAAATTAPAEIFADVIASDDNLVRVWRFNNADQGWKFYDPRPEFESANTLDASGAGDIVWVNVVAEQAFQGDTLVAGWNLIVLK